MPDMWTSMACGTMASTAPSGVAPPSSTAAARSATGTAVHSPRSRTEGHKICLNSKGVASSCILTMHAI